MVDREGGEGRESCGWDLEELEVAREGEGGS